MELNVRPVRRFVVLLDDPDETVVGGVVVRTGGRSQNLDYYVIRVGSEENASFGQGDRVVLADPWAGRKIKLDGIPLRVVRVQDVIGVIE